MPGNTLRTALAIVACASLPASVLAQDTATALPTTDVGGSVTLTNKGISLIPAFTLGKPATIVDVFIRRSRLGFEPQLRYALDGRPWAFLFWGRYLLLEREKLHVSIGAHPALNFRVTPVSINGSSRDVIVARRYVAGELSPTYTISSGADVGAYYLYSRGLESDVARNTHYLALRSNMTITLTREYSLRLAPQVYYLRMDSRDGSYFNSSVTLARSNFPLSISASASGPMRTVIAEGNDLLWNMSLTYSVK